MTKTLFVYATRHGFTQSCVDWMIQHCKGECNSVNLTNSRAIQPEVLEVYENILVGGSIHVGDIQKQVKRFVSDHRQILEQRKVGLFLSCMDEGEVAQADFKKAFPEWIRNHASAVAFTGAAFYFDRMNLLERWIIKRIHHSSDTVEHHKYDEMKAFLEKLDLAA